MYRILWVSPGSRVNRKLFKTVLNLPLDITLTAGFHPAVDFLTRQHPELIVIEIQKPFVRSVELTGLLRMFRVDIPILALMPVEEDPSGLYYSDALLEFDVFRAGTNLKLRANTGPDVFTKEVFRLLGLNDFKSCSESVSV